mmetsp:Transcript_4987/g.5184  ORF Transcript_4987/g.5184 Transcript_4987/m.5184 type:complete len:212 (-) Transcript_4987:105-740(-)
MLANRFFCVPTLTIIHIQYLIKRLNILITHHHGIIDRHGNLHGAVPTGSRVRRVRIRINTRPSGIVERFVPSVFGDTAGEMYLGEVAHGDPVASYNDIDLIVTIVNVAFIPPILIVTQSQFGQSKNGECVIVQSVIIPAPGEFHGLTIGQFRLDPEKILELIGTDKVCAITGNAPIGQHPQPVLRGISIDTPAVIVVDGEESGRAVIALCV